MGGHALLENVVLWEDKSSGWHILQENVFYWKKCLTGEKILLEGMSYWKTCIIAGHILQEYMSYRRMCLTGIYALQEYRSYWRVGFIRGMTYITACISGDMHYRKTSNLHLYQGRIQNLKQCERGGGVGGSININT